MITYTTYSMTKLIFERADPNSDAVERFNDVVDICVTFSYLLMLLGISLSIKRTIES